MSARRPIARLPLEVANQIAAGEVVERPASVLKELAENSLDADCRNLHVDLEGGGVGLIRVRDDGVGIAQADLRLALTPHATSKLTALTDLARLGTLGFRGEALPSIASVARLRLRSRPSEADGGWQVEVGRDGEPTTPAPAAMPPGTIVEVRDLFYNTPARRRFLRAERTEQRHLERVLKHLALARPDVGLFARQGERRILSVPPAADDAGRAARLARVLGRRLARSARHLDASATGLRLGGWVVDPSGGAGVSSEHQYFFINQRAVRDPVVRHAVRVAHEQHLEPGGQPAYVLYLEIDPAEVDVNVHPTKHEVRFREARLVHDFIVSALRSCLSRSSALEMPGPGAGPDPDPGPDPRPRSSGYGARGAVAEHASPYRPAARHPGHAPQRPGGGVGVHRFGRVVGWVGDRFAVAEVAGRLLAVDLVVALPRAAEAELGAALSGAPLTSRPLLVPVDRPVPEKAADGLEEFDPSLTRLGLVVRRVAPDRVSLRQVPHALVGADPVEVLAAIAEASGSGPEAPDRIVGRLVARLAGLVRPPGHSPGPRSLSEIQAQVDRLSATSVQPEPPVAGWLDEHDLARVTNPTNPAPVSRP